MFEPLFPDVRNGFSLRDDHFSEGMLGGD